MSRIVATVVVCGLGAVAASTLAVANSAAEGSATPRPATIDIGTAPGNAIAPHGGLSGRVPTFEPSAEVVELARRILNVSGLSMRYPIFAAAVPNAHALLLPNGDRVILYSTLFLAGTQLRSDNRWVATFVLAHEIGHHVHDHQRSRSYHKAELEADLFAGAALAKLGASLDQAKAAVAAVADPADSEKHPSRQKRIEAVSSGWVAARPDVFSPPPPPPPIPGGSSDGGGSSGPPNVVVKSY
jgi:Zn-dependent protease with chaperone function